MEAEGGGNSFSSCDQQSLRVKHICRHIGKETYLTGVIFPFQAFTEIVFLLPFVLLLPIKYSIELMAPKTLSLNAAIILSLDIV